MEKEKFEVKELAGGWITERKGTQIPAFLKLTYVGFSLFGVAYLFLHWMGEEGHVTRGALVKEANQVMPVSYTHLTLPTKRIV